MRKAPAKQEQRLRLHAVRGAAVMLLALISCAPVARSQNTATLVITLPDALARARTLSSTLEAAQANAKRAVETTVQARAANLPQISANSQYLYTQGNGTTTARYIANNGVHEYVAQTDVHQTFSAPLLLEVRRSAILESVAFDQAIVARRGLTVAVVQSYARLVAANGKLRATEDALQAAQTFATTTEALEAGGEVAHADVIKARIQRDDSQVALDEAGLVSEQARLELALLILPNINQPYEVADDPAQMLGLPAFADVAALAHQDNPDVEIARDTERAAAKDVTIAWAGYLPSLTLDSFYGIDANQFAVRTLQGDGRAIQNLGYSALASLTIPIFNWGATHSRVKQAEYREQQARSDLQYARSKLSTDLELNYRAAQTAQQELAIRRESVADAKESRRLVLLQYKAGDASALEVVNAEATLSLEENAYFDTETRLATALASLAALTGKLQ
jgi:outer membrane protein TolC